MKQRLNRRNAETPKRREIKYKAKMAVKFIARAGFNFNFVKNSPRLSVSAVKNYN